MATVSEPLTRENYDRDTHYMRHSAMKDFIVSPSLYKRKWIDGIRDPDTSAMLLGRVVHCLALEGYDEFQNGYAVAPRCDRRTKDGKARYEEFVSSSMGKCIIDAETYRTATAINEAIRSHDAAAQLLEVADLVEHPIAFHYHGLLCKARLDGIAEKHHIIIDLKTSRDPYPKQWSRQAYQLGYHRQARWYQEAASFHFGSVMRFIFIVVDSAPPHDVFCYELDGDAIALGEHENSIAINSFTAAIADPDFDWSHPESKGIRTLSLPKWAGKDDI